MGKHYVSKFYLTTAFEKNKDMVVLFGCIPGSLNALISTGVMLSNTRSKQTVGGTCFGSADRITFVKLDAVGDILASRLLVNESIL